MKLKSGLVLVVVSIISASYAVAQQGELFINEVMASNSQTLFDEAGNAEDWIELYNAGPLPVNLVGMWVSDDPAIPGKHVITGEVAELTVPSQGYLILWASGEPALGPRHLGFSLSSEGATILLTHANAQLIDMVALPEQYTDVSYGRAGDGANEWFYMMPPTPGTGNMDTGFMGQLPPPTFSATPGFHTGTLPLEIAHTDPDVVIYYSLDGSTPGPELLDGVVYDYKNIYPSQDVPAVGELLEDTLWSYIYQAPLLLTDASPEPNWLSLRTTTAHHYHPTEYMPAGPIRKGRVIRARATKPGYLPSEVATGTYFFTADGTSPHTLPVISLTTDKDHLFDHFNGVYNPGVDYEEWRLENMGELALGTTPANWARNTEEPIGMEWFDESSTARTFHRNAGFRTHGSYSKLFRRKSLRLYFRNEYGAQTLDHPMFAGQEDTDYKRLVVHISGNDDRSTNLRDMTMSAMLKHMRFQTLDARPATMYLNGEYWGVHAMRERYDQHYFKRVLGISENEIDVVERDRYASLGDSLEWSAFMEELWGLNAADPEVYEQLTTRVDIGNHIDYHVAQLYVGNLDWPHNNWKAYRKRTNGIVEGAPHGHDGRWRYLMYDLDWGFRLHSHHSPDYDYLALMTHPQTGENSLLFRRLIQNQDYLHSYLNRAADMANTAFRPEVITGIINAHRDLIAEDMVDHQVRWPDNGSFQDWNAQVDVMVDFGEQRAQLFMDELQGYFELPGQHQLQIDVSDQQAGFVTLNTIDLLATTHGVDEQVYPWAGTYFESVPVKLHARAFPGWEFSHWEGDLQGADSISTLTLASAASVTAVFLPVPFCAHEKIHYWHFNELPNGTITEIPADLASIPGGTISYAGNGAGYMDRTPDGEGTTLNAIDDTVAGRGLRARNPSAGRHLLIECPATGFRDPVLSFATHRTTAGPDSQLVSYTIDPDRVEWFPLGPAYELFDQYQLKTFSLDGELAVMDNADLAFKIEFLGPQASGPSGNSRFDNVRIDGRPINVARAVLCDVEDVFTYDGVAYGPGSHLLTNSGSMDCSMVELVSVELTELDTTVLLNGNVLSATAMNVTYQWIDCDGMSAISGADQQTFEPEDEGSYAVQLQSAECMEISSCVHAPGDLWTGISIHPNPAQDHLNIVFHSVPGRATYVLRDAAGRKVKEGSFTGAGDVLQIADLAPGTYLLEVRAVNNGREDRWVKVFLK